MIRRRARIRALALAGAAVPAVVAALVLAGCRRPPPTPPPLRVRLLTSAPISGRWERAAERGLGRIAAELGAEVVRVRAESERSRYGRLTEAGKNGVDLVFCVGNGFETAVYNRAAGYVATRFVLLPGRARGDNVAGVSFVVDGTGYLAGAVAATIAEEGPAGVIRGAGGGWLDDLEAGFVAGWKSRRRRGEVIPAEGKEAPWVLGARGATIALYDADSADPQVLAAAHDAGLLLVATDAELLASNPDIVVAAVTIDVPEAMLRVAREVVDGTFTGRTYAFDLGSGVLDLELDGALPSDRTSAVESALEAARAEVTAGIVEIEQLGF